MRNYFKPDENTREFGYPAEDTFHTLSEEDGEDANAWFFFRNFKMFLYKPDVCSHKSHRLFSIYQLNKISKIPIILLF